jgi:serine-aspartate repeat-containing protein C/D/E
LAGYLASTGSNQKENPNIGGLDNRGIDGDDNGDDVSGDICTNLVDLNDEEPLNEFGFTDKNDGDDGKSTPDNRSNLSIDFGVVPPLKKTVSVGDYIWIDTDKDGLQDPEELPLKGAKVTLLNKDGSPVVIGGDMAIQPQTTGEDGK